MNILILLTGMIVSVIIGAFIILRPIYDADEKGNKFLWFSWKGKRKVIKLNNEK